jgi:hypothetical protein
VKEGFMLKNYLVPIKDENVLREFAFKNRISETKLIRYFFSNFSKILKDISIEELKKY